MGRRQLRARDDSMASGARQDQSRTCSSNHVGIAGRTAPVSASVRRDQRTDLPEPDEALGPYEAGDSRSVASRRGTSGRIASAGWLRLSMARTASKVGDRAEASALA